MQLLKLTRTKGRFTGDIRLNNLNFENYIQIYIKFILF